MKTAKVFAAALVAVVLIVPVRARAEMIPDTPGFSSAAQGAVVMEAQSGEVVFAKNAEKQLPMASTTKIMSALITLEQPNLDDWFVVNAKAVQVEGSSMGLMPGDQVTLRGLAYGMLLPSGNDAANSAAVKISGSVEKFVELMNKRAKEIGLTRTHFVTPSGLPNQEHYSTAYDMAKLAREALKNPDFAEICGSKTAQLEFGNPPYKRWLSNHNRLLRSYEGAMGVKTGFTKSAGRCLVSAATRNGVTLIAVTLNCPDDWNAHKNMLDAAFALYEQQPAKQYLPQQITVPVTGGVKGEAALQPVGEPQVTVKKEGGQPLRVEICKDPFLYAPVKAGQVVGQVVVYSGEDIICEVPLVTAESVDLLHQYEEKKGLLEEFLDWLKQWTHKE